MALTGLKPPGNLPMEGDMASNWKRWYRSFEIYSHAAGISTKPERVQCSVFLHVAGPEAQELCTQFKMDEDQQDKLAPLVATFKAYCQSKSNITILRYRFNTFKQGNEDMDAYIRKLKSKIADCNYAQLEDELLCDRIVCGVGCDVLREKLLRTPNLEIEQCITLCRLSELQSGHVSANATAEEVNYIRRTGVTPGHRKAPPARTTAARLPQRAAQEAQDCGRCGYQHGRDACPARGKECLNCHKIGHFSKVCRTRGGRGKPIDTIDVEDTDDTTTYTEEDEHNSAYGADLYVGTVTATDSSTELWYKTYTIDNENIDFKLDTGSQANILPRATFDKLNQRPLQRTKHNIISYSGHRVTPAGETNIQMGGQQIQFLVVDAGAAILGKDACEVLGLITRVDTITTTNADPSDAHNMVNIYSDVFTGLGTIIVVVEELK